MSGCKALGNGFGLVSEGAEVPIENLPSADPAKIQTLPMVRTRFPFWSRFSASAGADEDFSPLAALA